ncbi:Sec-independent protein translocase TatC [Jatrophihabitans sp. GAS493]|uniref:twin-arginine translocase subunit TatC n=1 Tax=Jatrophihabitans sp. GAS493 TaxID=1907575 RepID=UPI000BB7BDD8|nr:twin-arginine translocase subunit TatC [Jatrophihabitans sp. GAS493]SOD73891.1 Sec-independent protein translocase TatC [Jatrophihabitans sp. GAS493]
MKFPKLRRRAPNPDARMSVLDHLRELRRRVIIVLIIVSIGAVFGWIFYGPILDFLKEPYCNVPASKRLNVNGTNDCALLFHGVLDGFTSRLKVSVIAGAILTAPLWLYQVWAFVTPGLRRSERRYTIYFIIASTLLFALGVVLAFAVLFKGIDVLISSAGNGVVAALTIDSYLSFVTLMLIVFGAAFEIPLLVVLANFAGALPAKLLVKSQRAGIFLIFLFAAVATPSTDPFTMCAMAVPMCVLFEVAVLVAVIHDRRKAKRLAAVQLPDDQPSMVDPIPTPLQELDQSGQSWSDTT